MTVPFLTIPIATPGSFCRAISARTRSSMRVSGCGTGAASRQKTASPAAVRGVMRGIICGSPPRCDLRCHTPIVCSEVTAEDPMNLENELTTLSDEALLARVEDLAGRERGATAQLIASLIELDVRKLYLGE